MPSLYILLLLHGLDVTPIIYMMEFNYIVWGGNQHFKIIDTLPSMKAGDPVETLLMKRRKYNKNKKKPIIAQ